MKKLVLILSFITITYVFSNAQQLTYKLKVVDTHQKSISGLNILVKETNTKDKIKLSTDVNGEVLIELNSGKRWSLSIEKMYNYKLLEVPERGARKSSEFMTYDLKRWERKNRPMPDRSKIEFTYIKQKIYNSTRPTKTKLVVQLNIKRADKKPLTYYPVQLTCLETNTIYTGKTDNQGIVRYLVPIGYDYEIDIDGIESYKFMEFLSKHPSKERYGFTYEPTNIKETTINDTITQQLQEKQTGTSARILYKIVVKDEAGDLHANEDVYLSLIKSKKVYTAKTNNDGEAFFLLPKGKKYLVSLDFQKDINVISLSSISGIGDGTMWITYKPDPRLEHPEQYIPSIESLFINEFNNFLTKQYPQPEKGKPLRIIVEWGNNLINGKSKEAVLHIGFAANNDESDKYGPPINVSFVMDKSGSMAGYDRIEELKKSLVNFVSTLRDDDIASLVIFDGEPELLIEAGKVGAKKNEFIEMINSVEANGYTNIYKGMVLGYEEVLKNMKPKGTNRLILLTDGYGETEVGIIINKSKEYNARGIGLSAIGVGQGYNQPLLKQLATNGGGLFQHIGDAYNLQESFKKELSGLLYPVARDVLVEIIYNNKIIFNHLYGFTFKKTKSNTVKMTLDNIYPGLTKLAIVKFDLNRPDKNIENQPVVIRMKYFNYKSNKTEILEEKAYLKWVESTGQLELIMESEQKKLYAIAIMNQSLKVMADAFSQDDFVKAHNAVNRAIDQIKEQYPNAKDEDIENLYKRLQEYSDILTQYKKNKFKK
ncbi:MAG: hypothetical protein DRI95_09250 [Bacteroidetes bacterium]|nr:MAG: hypothetical protein DRI95_09250 [Bacteroidota bacterium]